MRGTSWQTLKSTASVAKKRIKCVCVGAISFQTPEADVLETVGVLEFY